MAEEPSGLPQANTVVEMPWVLISNQIQQLSAQMNERFNDQCLRFDDRFNEQHGRFEDRFEEIDQRFEQADHRLDGLEGRLTFRNSNASWISRLRPRTAICGREPHLTAEQPRRSMESSNDGLIGLTGQRGLMRPSRPCFHRHGWFPWPMGIICFTCVASGSPHRK